MDDLRRRLRRLGVTTGREFKAKPKPPTGPDIDALVAGETVSREGGSCFVVTHSYPPETEHGQHQLSDWHSQSPQTLAHLATDDACAYVDLNQYLFLDTETTGLGGGSFAFLVGVGGWEDGQFIIRQYFLRDPADEPAMLSLLADRIDPDAALVTFNGRTFDVPLLSDRYVMNRQPTNISALPHLDLLHPARRLWRRRLPSCALSALETDVLGLQRSGEDVSGSLIPILYRQYLKTRSGRDMQRVLYHNEIDLLSMVTLSVTISQVFTDPTVQSLPVDDRLSLARWFRRQGLINRAERAYQIAADEAPDADTRYDALYGLAYLLKRDERREQALPLWRDLADLKFDTVGHEELAKHHEWQTGDLEQALHWTDSAIALAESWRPGLRRTETLRAFNHRRDRLQRKLNDPDSSTPHEEI